MDALPTQLPAVPLDTSDYPLLLRGFEKMTVRSTHYTPIEAGASPEKRPIQEYIRCVSRSAPRWLGALV